MKTQRKAGIAPTRKAYFQPDPASISFVCSSRPSAMIVTPAITLPMAESAWSKPSAPARERSGRVSATSATASPNTPPTPRPVRKR